MHYDLNGNHQYIICFWTIVVVDKWEASLRGLVWVLVKSSGWLGCTSHLLGRTLRRTGRQASVMVFDTEVNGNWERNGACRQFSKGWGPFAPDWLYNMDNPFILGALCFCIWSFPQIWGLIGSYARQFPTQHSMIYKLQSAWDLYVSRWSSLYFWMINH